MTTELWRQIEECARGLAAGEPVKLPIDPKPGAILLECFQNVLRQIEENGGSVQLGWQFILSGLGVIQAIHHAVWRNPQGALLDITPVVPLSEFCPAGPNVIIFVPDDLATLLPCDGVAHAHRRPNQYFQTADDKQGNEFIDLLRAKEVVNMARTQEEIRTDQTTKEQKQDFSQRWDALVVTPQRRVDSSG